MNLQGTSQYDPNMQENEFELLPVGDYVAMITNSEIKQSKSGANYLSIQWEVLQGALKGKIILENLNLWYSDPGDPQKTQTVINISQRALNAIKGATGVLNPQDSAEFHGKACLIKVGITKDGQFNNIKSHNPVGQENQQNQQEQQGQQGQHVQGNDKPAFMS